MTTNFPQQKFHDFKTQNSKKFNINKNNIYLLGNYTHAGPPLHILVIQKGASGWGLISVPSSNVGFDSF